MKLHYIAYRIMNPITGGEIYNEALLTGAESAGFNVVNWEGICFDKIKSKLIRLIFININYLFKVIFLSKKDIIIFDTDFHVRYLLALLCAKHIRKIKTIGIIHHYRFLLDKSRPANFFQYHFEKLTTNNFDYVIINSHFSFRTFMKLISKPIPYTIIYPFSKSTNNFTYRKVQFNPDKINLLQIGTIEERKNVLNTIKAMLPLKINYNLNFVGHCSSNKYLDQIRKFIIENQLEQKVFIHGRVDSDRLQHFFQNSSIFILVSKLEGYGMAYAEAMQYGLPIIGSTTGAVPELVEHDQNGYLCDPDKPEQITDAIIKTSDAKNWFRFHQNNLQKASNLMDKETFILHSKTFFQKLESSIFLDQ